MIDLKRLQSTFDTAGEAYQLMQLPSGAILFVTQRGGRILGVFPSGGVANLLWTNTNALVSGNALESFKTSHGWNLGGERVWIAPEVQYIIQDRTDFWGTHRLPSAIDPGNYTLDRTDAGHLTLSQSLTLTAYNLGRGTATLDVQRSIFPVPDPLRSLYNYEQLIQSVQFIGYSQTVTLREKGVSNLQSESWNLVQLQPGGQLYIPVFGTVDSSNYFGDVPDEARLAKNDGYLKINITGQRQYKIGYKATCMTGRMAYLNTQPDGNGYLLVRHFDNNPGATYSEEPPDQPGINGHSVHVYNDGGGFGGFGEMECSGQSIGGHTGRTTSTDEFQMWAYVGQVEHLKVILYTLNGVSA